MNITFRYELLSKFSLKTLSLYCLSNKQKLTLDNLYFVTKQKMEITDWSVIFSFALSTAITASDWMLVNWLWLKALEVKKHSAATPTLRWCLVGMRECKRGK